VSAHSHDTGPKIYGLLAEFVTPDELAAAITKTKAEGYTRIDGHTPYPVAEVADALGPPKSEMGPVMFIGGLIGAFGGYFMQYWTQAVDYRLNVAGRTIVSWPSFVPVTFELMVLTASLSGLFGLIALCGLPQLYHSLFNVKKFERASRDHFFMSIEATDAKFDTARTREFLNTLSPASVEEVPL
jgi:hypothetical protein